MKLFCTVRSSSTNPIATIDVQCNYYSTFAFSILLSASA